MQTAKPQTCQTATVSTIPSVLSVAGSDSSGGAGIQADLKTMEACGVFGQTAITALTAQNTLGVHAVSVVDPEFIIAQIDAVFDDIRPDAVKVGMLADAPTVHAVAAALEKNGARALVLDPVMVATSGDALSSNAAVAALVEELLPMADVVTPNLAEACVLSGMDAITTHEEMEQAAHAIIVRGAKAVLVKGGHLEGAADDVLLMGDGRLRWYRGSIVATANTHGTGCTLSSAIASYLARGESLEDAVGHAKDYLTQALVRDLRLGKGSGPLNHAWNRR